MSASLVRKGLEIVDSTYNTDQNRSKKKKEVFRLVPENKKFITKNHKKGGKVEKVNLLSHQGKITITEARRNFKTRDQILKNNLKKLKLIKKASKIDLDKNTVNQIIERAVTKRPVKKLNKQKKQNTKTAFTEEDFKKFEEEYFDDLK